MRKTICLLFCAVAWRYGIVARHCRHLLVVLVLLSTLNLQLSTVFAQGTAFTYQGRLNDGGAPANGNYDLRFAIYNAVTNGNTISISLTNSAVAVSNGLFVATLDFGSAVFTGQACWLDMGVRTNGSTNAFTVLVPRQQLTPTPYAIFANSASNLVGSLSAAQLAGTLPASAFAGYTNIVALTNGANLLAGAFAGNGGGVTNVNMTNLTGVLADSQLPTNTAFLNSNQTFTANNTFTGANTFTNLYGNSFSGSFFGNGLVGWIATNGTTVQAVSDTGYLLTNSQLVTVTLPASPNVGDIIRISGPGASGWQIAQNANQSILGNFSSLAKSYWMLSGASTALNWRSIASSSDGSHLVAVAGGNGGIYTSIDSGLTWSGPYGGISGGGDWRAVASSADGTKLPAALYNLAGGIFTNSGTTWTSVGGTGGTSANWISIASSADGTKLVAVVNGGGIYTSSNSGSSWTQRTSGLPGSANWTSVASSSDGTQLAAAGGSGIYVSSSSGASWSSSSGGSWSSIASSVDGSKLVAVVNGGGLYTFISGGSWTQRTTGLPSNPAWSSVASSADGSKLAAAVSNGGIYISSNFGVTWTQQTNAPTKNWSSIVSSADGSKLAAAVNSALNGGIYVSQTSLLNTTTVGTTGYIIGGQGSAVELQYIGNNQFMPINYAGTIWAY
jgi:hypothetical protein